jgi:indole-3-glycerol phosphate synthase
MNNILDKIVTSKIDEIEQDKKSISLTELKNHNKINTSCRNFVEAILKKHSQKKSGVIAEIKKASPSKGIIREIFEPVSIARSYEKGGAACLSILTDKHFFQGDLSYLNLVKNEVSLPILRKDFIIDPYQIYQAKAFGADCILLIVAILSDQQLSEFEQLAMDLDLSVLVEAHNEKELRSALKLKTPLIGINNRNLKTFDVSLETTISLIKFIGNDRIVVTESGIFTENDVSEMKSHGVNTFLIGESFMREEEPGEALAKMFRSSIL